MSIDSNLDMNEQNLKLIVTRLSNNYRIQKYFIQIIKDNLKLVNLGDKNAIIKLEKINHIMPTLIKKLELPFCDLLNKNNEIINYYIDNYINGKNDETSKNILINFIYVFNFKLTDINPIDKLYEKLKYTNINFKEIQENKRTVKSITENLYDELNQLYNNWKTIIESDIIEEEYYYEQLQPVLKEKEKKIKEIENAKLLPNATIEFLKEKIKAIENLNIKILNNSKIYTNTPNDHPNIQKTNGKNISIIQENNLTEEEKKQLREIELKKRTSFYKDEYLAYGEDELTEFKNYFYPLVEMQEKEIKRQYIGFLNSGGGRIYIGINDQKYVKGIYLTYKNCDIFGNQLVGLTSEFYPQCRLDKIKVYFIPIKSPIDKKFINNLYVVKIIILPGDPYSLYSLTKKGGFISAIRRQRQVFNLDAEEIANKIIERKELKKSRNNQIQVPDLNLEFNDPEPEKNLFISSKFDEKSDIISINSNSINNKKSNNSNQRKKYKKNCIYIVNIRNIDINLKVKDINKIFTGLQQSYQKFYSKEGKSIGYGKIHFVTEEAANLAIKKFNGHNLGGKRNIVMTLQKNKFFNKINK